MAQDVIQDFTPSALIHYGPGRPIRDGDAVAIVGEQDLAANVQHVWGAHVPQLVNQIMNHDCDAGDMGDPGWIVVKSEQGTGGDLIAAFYLPVMVPWNGTDAAVLRVHFRARMASGSNAGSISATLNDASETDSVTITDFATNPNFRWYTAEIDHSDDTTTEDKLVVALTNGSGGEEVQLHSVSAHWAPITDTGGGVYSTHTLGAAGEQTNGYVPFDSQEFDQDSPLSTEIRHRLFDNVEITRKKGEDVIWSFSDLPDARVATAGDPYSVPGSNTHKAVRIKFRSKPGQKTIRWAALLEKSDTSATGYSCRIRTTHEVAMANGSQTVGVLLDSADFVASSAWDYAGADNTYLVGWETHGTHGTLDCYENAVGEIVIELQAKLGQTAWLRGFSAWYEQVT